MRRGGAQGQLIEVTLAESGDGSTEHGGLQPDVEGMDEWGLEAISKPGLAPCGPCRVCVAATHWQSFLQRLTEAKFAGCGPSPRWVIREIPGLKFINIPSSFLPGELMLINSALCELRVSVVKNF